MGRCSGIFEEWIKVEKDGRKDGFAEKRPRQVEAATSGARRTKDPYWSSTARARHAAKVVKEEKIWNVAR